MTNIHVDAISWQENWEEIAVGPAGGQASSKIVRSRDGSTERAFLKILNKQNDDERRARLYREVASLETLSHEGVPRLKETNARNYENKEFRLYLVTDFIEGQNLSEARSISSVIAINIAIQLCDILEVCHAAGVVHRDIKPDNCIIAPTGKLFLVDFGLAFRADDETGFATPIAQEIGNRFLRLPEYHADSVNKSDPRTDLTGCVAILFFLLAGIDPRVLVDENNKYPHQRDPPLERIRASGIPRLDRLLALFDQGFQPALDSRFQSATALRAALSACLTPEGGEQDSGSIAARIREKTNSPLYVQQRSIMEKLYAIQGQIYNLSDQIVGSLGGAFSLVGSSNEAMASTGTAIYRLGFSPAQNIQRIFMPNYVLQHLGNEIILKVVMQRPNGNVEEFAARIPSSPGTLDAAVLDRLRAYLLGKLEKMLT